MRDHSFRKRIVEIDKLARELSHQLSELRSIDEEIAYKISAEIKSEIDIKTRSNEVSQGTPPPERLSNAQIGIPPGIDVTDFEAVNVNKEGVRSYYTRNDFSPQKIEHRVLRAKIVDKVILGLIFANMTRKQPITYPDIQEELDRLGLSEERATTYARISRLRKEKLIAEIDPENRSAYLLTNAGRSYFAKLKEHEI